MASFIKSAVISQYPQGISPSSAATTLICGFNTCSCRVSLCIFHTAPQFSGRETITSPEQTSPLSFLPHLLRAKG